MRPTIAFLLAGALSVGLTLAACDDDDDDPGEEDAGRASHCCEEDTDSDSEQALPDELNEAER